MGGVPERWVLAVGGPRRRRAPIGGRAVVERVLGGKRAACAPRATCHSTQRLPCLGPAPGPHPQVTSAVLRLLLALKQQQEEHRAHGGSDGEGGSGNESGERAPGGQRRPLLPHGRACSAAWLSPWPGPVQLAPGTACAGGHAVQGGVCAAGRIRGAHPPSDWPPTEPGPHLLFALLAPILLSLHLAPPPPFFRPPCRPGG